MSHSTHKISEKKRIHPLPHPKNTSLQQQIEKIPHDDLGVWDVRPKKICVLLLGDSLILYGLGLYQRPLAPSNLRGGTDLLGNR